MRKTTYHEVNNKEFSEKLKKTLAKAMLEILQDNVELRGLDYKVVDRIKEFPHLHGYMQKEATGEKIMNLEIRYFEEKKEIKNEPAQIY